MNCVVEREKETVQVLGLDGQFWNTILESFLKRDKKFELI